MTRGGRYALFGFAVAIGLAFAPEAFALCPMCRTALESPEARGLAMAFNRGILFLLAMPFTAIALIAGLIWREHRLRLAAAGVDETPRA